MSCRITEGSHPHLHSHLLSSWVIIEESICINVFFSGWLSFIKPLVKILLVNSLVLHSEQFSLQTKYKTAVGGLVTSLCTALALPILIPSIFMALQMSSAFYETLSLCISLPTSVLDTGHLR